MNTPKLFFSLLFSCTIVIISCEKEDDFEPLPTLSVNKAPIARAGADTSIALASCADKVSLLILDGSRSSDPENKIISYSWNEIDSSMGLAIRNADSAIARVENISPGQYLFELTVKDAALSIAKDTMAISITAPAQEYDLDLTFSSFYTFTENVTGCGPWDYDCYDLTEIKAKGVFPSLGELSLHIAELSDMAAVSNVVTANIYISDGQDKYLGGLGTVNFKKLIRQGGGSFTDTLRVGYTSAQRCDPDVIRNMPPLRVTGKLNTSTKAITLSIKGKTYL